MNAFVTRRGLCLAAAAAAAWPALAAPLAVGERVRWPVLKLLGGATIGPADLQDQAVVVVFWLTTCPFCARHNPHVEKLHRAARGKRLRVITAAGDGDEAAVQQYLSRNGYTFPVTMQTQALRPLFTDRRVVPLTAVVGRDGRLREVVPGEMFEEDVLALLALAG